MRSLRSAAVFAALLASISQPVAAQEFREITGVFGQFGVLTTSPPANEGWAIAGSTVIPGIGPAIWTESKGVVSLDKDPNRNQYGGHGTAVAEDGSYFAG